MLAKSPRTKSLKAGLGALGIAGLMLSSVVMSAGSAAAAGQLPPGDPPGNNGTIKFQSDLTDPDPGNEPQLDNCLVWLQFFNYDLNQQAVITFTLIPPTGSQQLLSQTAVISDDPAGGGTDLDATLSYNLSAALQGLPVDAAKGYHVRVSSDTVGAPGGAKTKNLWMRCGAVAAGSLRITKTVEGSGKGPFAFSLVCNHSPLDRTFTLDANGTLTVTDVPDGTVCVVTETDKKGAQKVNITESPTDGNLDGKVKVLGKGAITKVGLANIFPGSEVGAAGASRSGELPATGTNTIAVVALGLSMAGLGVLAKLYSRQPTGDAPSS